MTTVRIHYSYYGFKYCNISITGQDKCYWDDRWRKIEYDKCDRCRDTINKLKVDKGSLQEQIKVLTTELTQSKKWYRPWYTSKEKILIQRRAALQNKVYELTDRIDTLNQDRFYNAWELYYKATEFLQNNRFTMTSSIEEGHGTRTEIWTKY